MCLCRLPRTMTMTGRALREHAGSHPPRWRRWRVEAAAASSASEHTAPLAATGNPTPLLGLNEPKLMASGEMASLMSLVTASPTVSFKEGATSVWVRSPVECPQRRACWLLLGTRRL